MATRERTRRPQQGQLELGDAFSLPTPAVAGVDDAGLQERLCALASTTEARFTSADDAAWAVSPFGWVKRLPTVTRGKAAAALVSALLGEAGAVVGARTSADHDFTVNGRRVRLKLSTRWASGEYNFQQLKDGPYDVLMLLGLSPDRAHLWAVSRQDAMTNLDPERNGAAWLTFTPDTQPGWLMSAGDLDAALDRVTELVGA